MPATADPSALLHRLLQETAETTWLEFKLNNKDPEEIGRCVSACANGALLADRDRAFIVWGVDNSTKKPVGTSVHLSQLKKGGEVFSNWLSRLLEPRLMLEFLDFEVDGQRFAILVIEPSYDRPVKFSGCEYIRVGENVKKLAEYGEHERALWLATSRRKFEGATALAHVSAESILALLDTSAYYKLSGKPQPGNRSEVIRQFMQSGFVRDDMEGGLDITNLGAILFATDITEFPSIATKSVRVIHYAGRDKQESVAEREGQKGYAVGFEGLISFALRQLPTKEHYVGGIRKNVSLYSAIAIREIIANALIHQDFTISGTGPVVEIYADRVEVTNPGNSLISVDRIIDDRRSRNEKLAATMRELGICEERGGGIDKAIIEIEEMSLPAPEFYRFENSMRVVIYGPKTFNQLTRGERVWSCYCHAVIRWLRRDYMSNASLRKRFSLSDDEYQAVSGIISAARKEDRIVEAEPGQGKRNARYIPYWAA